MPSPTLAPRMEEADTPPSPRIAPMDLLACAQLARPADEPEVIFGIRASVRPRNDRVNGEWPRPICLACDHTHTDSLQPHGHGPVVPRQSAPP
jgi:hypothetical protein